MGSTALACMVHLMIRGNLKHIPDGYAELTQFFLGEKAEDIPYIVSMLQNRIHWVV